MVGDTGEATGGACCPSVGAPCPPIPARRTMHSRGGLMRPFEIGLVLPLWDSFVDGSTSRWVDIRSLARRAEELGFDTVWVPDELLWRPTTDDRQGWWEAVAMAGAVAAATSRVKVGTWILSALHRNPGITAHAVETIADRRGGRFVFWLGSGHAGSQAHAFVLPEDHVYGRFAEAL